MLGLKLGPVVLVGIPGEPFTQVGVKIKEAEGFSLVLPCALTNGYEGYYPDEDSYNEPGYSYERAVSPFASNCSRVLIEGALSVLEELQK